MATGNDAHHLVTPSLHRRKAPLFMPTTTVAVRKAVRDFDEYVHEAAALGVHLGYEIPKKAVKSGVTDVEVTMSETQVALFFPDQALRAIQRGKASWYDWMRHIIVFVIALVPAVLFYHVYYVPTWVDLFWQWVWVAIQWATYASECISAIAIILLAMMPLFICGALYAFVPFFLVSVEWDHRWISFVQENVCAVHYHPWFCPAYGNWRYPRLALLADCARQAFWAAVPLLRRFLFWESVLIFICVWLIVNRLTRRRTIWTVRLRIETQAFSVARCQKTRAKQETTSEKVAATPIITHVENYVKMAHTNMPTNLRDKYLAVCLLIASGWADNRVRVVQTTISDADTEPIQDNSRESLGDLGAQKRLLKTRNNTAPPNVWRKSVRVIKKSYAKLFDDVQRGQDRVLPGQDEDKERYSGVVTGPEFFYITEGFEGSMEDEIAGVSRHLRQLKSTVTGEYLDREIAPDAEARLERATDIICNFVKRLAKAHYIEILAFTLPQKWGSQREVWYQRLVEVGRTVVQPFLSGFVKTCELALPINKLPRLVGSMGMLCCAKDAASLCSVEQLFKKYMPHLVVKGMTQDGVNSRFASFARRAKRLGLKILSIDMSAMDSSWTKNDRARVRRVLHSIVDVLQELLEAELQQDYVTQCAAKKRALRWILKYIEVQLAAEDSILFSGERGTSIGNRILMLIVWAAELLRAYGDDEGEDRILRMFRCPAEAQNITTDERARGITEQHAMENHFPDDERYDNNIGDGDDCTLAVPHTMYASEEEFILAYEAYYKLVEPCSAWDEGTDMECLSMMCITAGDKQFFVPKVARNAQRLIAHKIRVLPGKHFAEGCLTYSPTPKEYAEIATDLWQRSFALRHTMVCRHLNRAMFEYCYSKSGDVGTVYDDDQKRLGKVDGDLRLSECLENVRANATCDVSGYVMVKATNFNSMACLSSPQIQALKAEWYESDIAWSVLELTDDLCANPDILLQSFPIGVNVAAALGFKLGFQEQLKRQLVKGEGVPPDMSGGTRPGGREVSTSDGAGKPTTQQPPKAASVIVHKDGRVLCGYEPQGKPRVGMLTFPGGKLEEGEFFEAGAIRELEEEGGLTADPSELKFVREHLCGKLLCKQYTVEHAKTRPASVLTADQLTDFKFRSAAEIIDQHAPNKIANCLKEAIVDGEFIPAAFGRSGQPAARAPPAPGSSARVRPPFEVKAVGAEPNATGPSQSEDYTHSHICPVCGDEYTHSHPHDKRFEHAQRAGACPNEHCSNHKSARTSTAGADTSRDQKEFRQPSGSRPVNGYGTPVGRKSEAKGKAGNNGSGLSPHAVSQNAGKSHAAGAESKGRSKGGKGQLGTGKAVRPHPAMNSPVDGEQRGASAQPRPKMWKPKLPVPAAAVHSPPQTAPPAMTLVPNPPPGPPIEQQESRVSEGRQVAFFKAPPPCPPRFEPVSVTPGRASSSTSVPPGFLNEQLLERTVSPIGSNMQAERAGISGHRDPNGGDRTSPPPRQEAEEF